MHKLLLIALLSLWFVHQAHAAGLFKNGFDLSGASIKAEDVLPGGPPRDGIPAIDQPKFIAAEDADFLSPGDRVLGLERGGVIKAYPIAIMNWHEIVNDHFNGEPIVVTFCPLCGTGIAFEALIEKNALTFGVSGLLYNSDVLLYDRDTESLWSQILMQGVSGAYNGHPLTQVALQHTSWADWREQYPETLVLSQETGYSRNYQRSPYRGYESSRQIYFPVEFRSKGYHPKERVLGLEINGRYKAYPFLELAKADSEVNDRIAGEQVKIRYDADHQTARAFDRRDKLIPSVTSFWFAWYTFHPETSVFKAE